MSCEVAALPFQANANYGTWSIVSGDQKSNKDHLKLPLISKVIFITSIIYERKKKITQPKCNHMI